MIDKLKRWIGRVAQAYNDSSNPVPTVVAHGSMPTIQIFKIANGYLLHKVSSRHYQAEEPSVIYCATPLDVARQIMNAEAFAKLGIEQSPQELQTTGRATGSFNKI